MPSRLLLRLFRSLTTLPRRLRAPLPPYALPITAKRLLISRLSLFSAPLAMASSTASTDASTYQVTPYQPSHPAGPFPYTTQDLTPADASSDARFYVSPRFVNHIDDAAIAALRRYYASALPPTGHVLDLCSSWVSHLPAALEARAAATAKGAAADDAGLRVVGVGMNAAELRANPVLSRCVVRDLNARPELAAADVGADGALLDAATCVVSVDYLTQPVAVLAAVRGLMRKGGTVHLAISNRCFPTKAVARWLRVGEPARLAMVGDYLWWAGFREVEIVTVVPPAAGQGLMGMFGGGGDPLWVVRGRNPE